MIAFCNSCLSPSFIFLPLTGLVAFRMGCSGAAGATRNLGTLEAAFRNLAQVAANRIPTSVAAVHILAWGAAPA